MMNNRGALTNSPELDKHHIASRFSKASHQYYTLACIQNQIAQDGILNVPSNQKRVLDIGCASGEHTRQLGNNVIGVDLAFGMVKQAKHNTQTSHWINADMDALPFANASFTHVFSSMAMQWSSSPQQVLSEIKRVLVPQGGGTLIIPVKGAFWQLKQAYAETQLTSKLIPLRSANDWLCNAQMLGFKILNSEVRTYVDKHSSLLNVLRSISKVGASSCLPTTDKNLTKTDLVKLSQGYPNTSNHSLKTSGSSQSARSSKAGQSVFELDYKCIVMSVEA